MVANRMADKDETIAQLRTQVSQMTLAASQQAQNNYLVNQLRPPVNPAYLVQNPYAGTGYAALPDRRTDRLLQHGGVKIQNKKSAGRPALFLFDILKEERI